MEQPAKATAGAPTSTTPSPDVPIKAALVVCPRCKGAGSAICRAPGCVNGKVECPGPCLKLSVGKWEHLNVAGHDPKELWQKFQGKGEWNAWTTAHIGEVIVIRDGKPVNIGTCSICQGHGKVDCKACEGTGKLVCTLCMGSKQLTDAKAREYAANSQNQESALSINGEPIGPSKPSGQIKLKDGRSIDGKVIAVDEEVAWIKTSEGKTIQVKASDLLIKP